MSTASDSPHEPARASRTAQPTSVPVLKRTLVYGGFLAVVIAVVGSVLGWIFARGEGVAGALIGTAIAIAFMGITSLSIIIANRYAGRADSIGAFFGIVMGGWLLKFVVFVLLLILLRDQPWLNSIVLFLCIVAGIIGSLIVDMVVIARSRVAYASDVTLPPAPEDD